MCAEALIDWAGAEEHALWACADPPAVKAAMTAAVSAAPCFQNRDFPLSPVPLLVRAGGAEDVRPRLEAYVRLLGKVVALYRDHADVRAWYGLGSAAERLVAADRRLGDAPWVCRLDGYVERDSGELKLLENNADAPAGTLFTARVNDVVREVLDPALGRSWPAQPPMLAGDGRFLSALLDAASHLGAPPPESIAILQPRDAASRETRETVAAFRAAGHDAYLADPRDLAVVRGRAHFGSRPADLCWNKINTVGWRELDMDGETLRRWERALLDDCFVHVNPFGARYVAESKLTLAFLQEPRFAELLSEPERELVGTLLPWSRRATSDGAAPQPGGTLAQALLADRAGWVLKQPYDIRGDGVTIGHDCPPAAWRAAVTDAVGRGHLAQRRVVSTRYPVVEPGSGEVALHNVSLDTYVLGGQVAGFGSKASPHAKVNVFQGGRKLAVYVVGARRP